MTKCLIIIFLLSVFLSCNHRKAGDSIHPNIIFILADDLGYGDLRCYNPNSKIPTPNLDMLAMKGMRFTDAHSPSALCTPTRYSIMTGKYCWRTELKSGVLLPYDKPLIHPGETTLASLLNKNGYSTAAIGKWHLGWDWPTKEGFPENWELRGNMDGKGIDFSKVIHGGPVDLGFEYYYGMDVPNFPPYCYIENNRIVGTIPSLQKPDSIYGDPGVMQEGWNYESMLSTITNKAKDYISEQARQQTKPFFLYFALTAPHVPLSPSYQFKGKSQAGNYGDLVAEMDYSVGEIINHLEKLELLENTLIIFTSDNGSHARTSNPERGNYCWGVGDLIHEYNHYPNGLLKGFKGDAWEGGHRIPFIVHWPEVVKQNSVNNQLICLTDMLPTVAALLNNPLPGKAAPDGINIMATLKNSDAPARDVLVLHSASGKFAVRKNPYKLILADDGGSCFSAAYFEKYTPGEWQNNYEGQLYNIQSDIQEENNLYGQMPETVEQLKSILHDEKK
ncbi:MAG: sulfatase family protein [Bacteroidota bacterium]